jgi:hypothetical protein
MVSKLVKNNLILSNPCPTFLAVSGTPTGLTNSYSCYTLKEILVEYWVAKGHKAIDTVFSTDQAEHFTPEARANDPMNNFAIGFLPPPGAVFKTVSDTSKFARAGKAFDRAGYTKAGRNLMKHGYREGSAFPKPLGNPTQVNAHGQ